MDAKILSSTRTAVVVSLAVTLMLLAGCDEDMIGMGGVSALTAGQDVTAPEDLLREHGVLRRLLLVYQESANRLEAGTELPPGTIVNTAQLVRIFVEQYHEKLEEDYIFPRFEQAGVLVDLVTTLRQQHEAGRVLTAKILLRGSEQNPRKPEDRAKLVQDLREFVRMYQPHAAWEDTVLFPAMRQIFSPREYAGLGDSFEDKEAEMLGPGGFERMVEKTAAIEKTLGIYELEQFTPRIEK